MHRKYSDHGEEEKGLVVRGKIIARISDLIGSSFRSKDEHWTSRQMHIFLILKYKQFILHTLKQQSAQQYTLERIMKVVLADGILMLEDHTHSAHESLK